MNTISEIIKNNYEIFNSIEDKRVRGTQVNAIKYIQLLASVSKTDVTRWEVAKVFKKKDSDLLESDKNKINKIFFTYRDANVPEDSGAIPFANELAHLSKSYGNVAANRLITKADDKEHEARYFLGEAHKKIKEAFDFRQRSMALRGVFPNYIEEIKEVERRGFFRLDEVNESSVYLDTINPVVLFHVNESLGIKQSVDFGIWTLEINLGSNFFVKAYLKSGGVAVGSNQHPHVYNDGRLCFGSINGTEKALSSGSIKSIAELCEKVLGSYNHESPIREFNLFYEMVMRREGYVKDTQGRWVMPNEAVGTNIISRPEDLIVRAQWSEEDLDEEDEDGPDLSEVTDESDN